MPSNTPPRLFGPYVLHPYAFCSTALRPYVLRPYSPTFTLLSYGPTLLRPYVLRPYAITKPTYRVQTTWPLYLMDIVRKESQPMLDSPF